jgi:hypothetical protein
LGIVLSFAPLNTQVYAPLAPKQVRDFAALVALGPAVILIAVKSAGEYEIFHSSPAGLLAAELKERLRVALPPAGAVPEERDNETCADVVETAASRSVEKSASRAGQDFSMFIGRRFFLGFETTRRLGNSAVAMQHSTGGHRGRMQATAT